jgi:hypothetical protein
MSWANSFIPSATVRDSLMNVIALAPGSDTINIALYDTNFAQTIDDDPFSYSATNEVTGTNWSSGGVALASPAVTLVSTTGVKFDATDVSVASTTISTGVLGAVIYDDSLSPKAGFVAVYFGGTSYTTNNGTFGITWDSSGIFTVQLH